MVNSKTQSAALPKREEIWYNTDRRKKAVLQPKITWEEKFNHMDLEFKKLCAESVEGLTQYYEQRHDMTCDSVILDNFLWGNYYHIHYAVRDDRAVLYILNIFGKKYASLPVCRMEDMPRYFHELECYFNENLNLPLEIYLADEPAVEYLNLPPDRYTVTELPDYRDYLYSAQALKTLSGKALHKKKNNLNYFCKSYEGRYEYRPLCCSDRDDVWKFLQEWREKKGQEVEGHLDYEVEGIHRVLKNCSMLNVRMGGIYVDDRMEAFSIGSYNTREKMAIIHIEKANPDMRGLYQLINQQFLIHAFPEAEIVNREDDMGLPGLRKAKESYNPMGYAKKFRICQIWPKES